MTGKQKDIDDLREAAPLLPAGTRVNVTFLGNENLEMRIAASKAVLELGFTPVPHVSARRLHSEAELTEFLAALQEIGASKHIFSVGGDPAEPMGPYGSSLEVIQSGLLPQYGVEDVSIAGYPEGHPDIASDVLWRELEGKAVSLREQNLSGVILTQFGFDTDPVASWVNDVRGRGIDFPIRIGTPGPAGIKRLINFAKRFGVGANAMIVKKYGFSLTNLIGTAGPDKFITELGDLLAAKESAGDVGLHFYTFGGMTATSKWAQEFTARQEAAK
ncbi:methylenetetrahydrofolate reductase [Pseudoclavibacter endophyticus]|uniref:Methylenetetrahydrofolate reductase n=2 Tax=Pseudoclavibacter endophyticus TaxID=1778590 RepID=A0A6H9WQU1_9MICO|nr:methylenetetrahydrofolate reductase [Pseudoclavibacter endophyticus]